MSTYVIGDIQGCFASFRHLLEVCAFDPAKDKLWLVGDLVNRGPDSLSTLRYVKSLGDAAVTVLGNHDLYLLMIAELGDARRSRDDTLQAVLDAPDRAELLDWLRQRPLCHVEGEYCMVHAGLLPQWSVKKARNLAAEVEERLRGEKYREFLAQLWGSKPNFWSGKLEGMDRLRVIVNAMTRMRFCSIRVKEGKNICEMNFAAKGKVENAPKDCLPWFDLPERKSANQVLVTGHWSALGLKMTPNLLALDSGCLWGGQLSAVRLEDRTLFQVECSAGESRALED
ncbi:bis(5'-nucleosyl)-tetraphosphatase, symmetrical [Betaproteobacteria bacterium]|nr:bis(5'-nucleosyl)-tetraphosphatase, symmetrical [Betaproteobacteria bacterium]GHU45117.1 bis(5'-nucleosyl)-tetraphosphatase, symmetrical [Betaproteobacteria bacterium]